MSLEGQDLCPMCEGKGHSDLKSPGHNYLHIRTYDNGDDDFKILLNRNGNTNELMSIPVILETLLTYGTVQVDSPVTAATLVQKTTQMGYELYSACSYPSKHSYFLKWRWL